MGEEIIIKNEKNLAELKRRKRILMTIGMVAVLGLIAGLIALLVHVSTRRYDVVRVSNFGELAYRVPDRAQEEFGGYLYHLLRQYFEVPGDGSTISAKLRPETLVVSVTEDIDTVEFIVDVDDYKQSYKAVLSWSDSGAELAESARIECTTRAESKFPEADCYGMNTTSNSVEPYLPHELHLNSGERVELDYGFTTSEGNDIVVIRVGSCGNKEVEDEALSRAQEWIQKQGINDENVVYKVEPGYTNCVLRGGN